MLTFVNKMDRPGLDPIELMDDVGTTLNIRTVALNWPIGSGKEFKGVYDRLSKEVLLFDKVIGGTARAPVRPGVVRGESADREWFSVRSRPNASCRRSDDDLEYPASAQLLDGTILTIYSRSGR